MYYKATLQHRYTQYELQLHDKYIYILKRERNTLCQKNESRAIIINSTGSKTKLLFDGNYTVWEDEKFTITEKIFVKSTLQ